MYVGSASYQMICYIRDNWESKFFSVQKSNSDLVFDLNLMVFFSDRKYIRKRKTFYKKIQIQK